MKYLYINPEVSDELFVAILSEDGLIKNITADNECGLNEQLLTKIDSLLKSENIGINELTKIAVNCSGGTFSSLRTVIATANALAFALKIPVVPIKKNSTPDEVITQCVKSEENKFKPVFPVYDREPNITKAKASE